MFTTTAVVDVNNHPVKVTIVGDQHTTTKEYMQNMILWIKNLENKLRSGK